MITEEQEVEPAVTDEHREEQIYLGTMQRCILYRRLANPGNPVDPVITEWFTNLRAAKKPGDDDLTSLWESGPTPVTVLIAEDGRYYPLTTPGKNEIQVVR